MSIVDHVENQTFRNEMVTVDGRQFKACTFDNTTLVFTGETLPTFVDCRFSDVSLRFEGAAASTLKFLSGLSVGGFAQAVDNIFDGVRTRKL